MQFQIKKVTVIEESSDPSKPARTTVSRRLLVGEAAEPARPIHALFLISPTCAMAASYAMGAGVIGGVIASFAGVALAGGVVSMAEQARHALAARGETEGASKESIGAMGKAKRGLLEFSRLARSHARLTALNLGWGAGGTAALAADLATRKLPRANAWVSRANPRIRVWIKEAAALSLEHEINRGPKRCERLFFARLAEMEEGKCEHPAGQLERIWRGSGMNGSAVDLERSERGTVATRLESLLSAPPEGLSKAADFDREAVERVARLCAVSAEAVALEGVVGEAALSSPQAPSGPRRARL